MESKPKRRWFRFSLRTMFVMVTIFGVWLGWQVKIRERKSFVTAEGIREGAYPGDAGPNAPCDPPWPLAIFGERGRPGIQVLVSSADNNLWTADDHRKIDKAKQLFSESAIFTHHEKNAYHTFTLVRPRPR